VSLKILTSFITYSILINFSNKDNNKKMIKRKVKCIEIVVIIIILYRRPKDPQNKTKTKHFFFASMESMVV